MRVLIVSSGKSGKPAPFVADLEAPLARLGVQYEYHLLKGQKGVGYIIGYFLLKRRLSENQFDIVHAHFGLSGLLAALQRKVPVVITFHGTDVNNPILRVFSKLALRLSSWGIFVSTSIKYRLGAKERASVIPCGVDFDLFKPMDKMQCRKGLGLDPKGRYILFSSRFDRPVKNATLARMAVSALEGDYVLLELKGYNRSDVVKLMNAADLCLLTSHMEGSPQFVKEALACNVPVVTTDVGDVRERYSGIENCLITASDPEEIANAISRAFKMGKVNSRDSISDLDNNRIGQQVLKVYMEVIKSKEY